VNVALVEPVQVEVTVLYDCATNRCTYVEPPEVTVLGDIVDDGATYVVEVL